MVPNMHGCGEVCNFFLKFFEDFTIVFVGASLVRYSSLCLLDFLHVLALGNELLGEVVSLVVFADDEGAVKKFSETFQRENVDEGPIYCY